jgi:hypothetical protein
MLPHRFRETGDFHGRTTEAASSHFYLTSPYSERLSGPFRSEDDALEHLYNMYG